MPRAPKRKAEQPPPAPAPAAEPQTVQKLLSWLRECGAEGLDDLDIRADGLGGLCVFARRLFAAGDRIASLPQRCVLSARAAEESELGKAVRKAAAAMGPTCEALLTEEALLWIFLSVGRIDAAHPWHAYLSSLPATSPEPTCWPAELRNELASTPVGASVSAALDAVQAVVDGLGGRLARRLPTLLPEAALTLESLLWARGMCRSRAFPTRLLSQTSGPLKAPDAAAEAEAAEAEADTVGGTAETWGQAPGVLLPLFDLLNHNPATRIAWLADDAHVTFVSEEQVGAGVRVRVRVRVRMLPRMLPR